MFNLLLEGKRVVIYRRVSTDDQKRHGHSLELQPERIRRWVEAMGGKVIGVLTDNVSAGKPFERREGGREVLAMMEEGKADAMAVTRFDRAFRVTIDGLVSVQDHFLNKGRTVVAVETPIDIRTPFGWKQFINMVADAEYERALIGERARETSEELRRAGKKYGPVPFGCVAVEGALFRDPVLWATRQAVVDLMNNPGASSRMVAAELNSRSIPAPGRMERGRAKGGRRWHHTTVLNIAESHHELEHIPMLSAPHEMQVSH